MQASQEVDAALLRLSPRLTPYIRHTPTPKQTAALILPHREVFYGGAAGGGKSDWLLMSALQYVDIPSYSAILFRRRLTDLRLRGALLDRANEWLSGTDAVWSERDSCWYFPSGATLQFGYLDTGSSSEGLDKFRYQSAHFQFIGFDELTQFFEDDYLYLFSRLRRSRCGRHPRKPHSKCKTCREFSALRHVPLRMRSASNPGGVGHHWVKERFRIRKYIDPATGIALPRGFHPDRPYVPAFVQDNPYLDVEEYKASLSELDPVTRDQLLSGDWDAAIDGRFRRSWLRRYSMRGDSFQLHPRPAILDRQQLRNPAFSPASNQPSSTRVFYKHQCRLVAFCDPAASVREGPGDAVIWRKMPSWTVIAVFWLTPQYDLLLWDVYRARCEVPGVLALLQQCVRDHLPYGLEFIGIEASGLGIGVYQTALQHGLPVRPLATRSQDKLVRATQATVRMEQGKIFFPEPGSPSVPKHASFLEDWEAEIFNWTGHPQEQSDQVDVLAYAARWASSEAGSEPSFFHEDMLPTSGSLYGDGDSDYLSIR